MKNIDVNNEILIPINGYYTKLAFFILTRLENIDDKELLVEIGILYKSAFNRREHNHAWVEYWKSLRYDDFNKTKKYYMEYARL